MDCTPNIERIFFLLLLCLLLFFMLKLIAISWPTFFKDEAEVINALFESGLPLLHLRKPNADVGNVEKLIKHISPEFHDRLTMHYFPQLAADYELGGYHFSKGFDEAPGDDWEGRLSASCHSIDEANARVGELDYVFLSPIFDSISKEGYKSAFAPDLLWQANNEGRINRRMIALGGVTPENMSLVQDYGFGGAAVLGGLWKGLSRDEIMNNYWRFLNWQDAMSEVVV